MVHTLVVKVLRACNLRCDYCYYINEDTPHYGMEMSDEVLDQLYASFAQYLKREDERGTIIWHGGEPLMLGRERFTELLDRQQHYFAPGTIRNHLQTNGLLVDDDWIDFFLKHDVKVGLSLDGTRETHDRHRVTKGGHGSYDLAVRAIRRLRRRGVEVGVLSVMGSTDDGRGTLEHLRDELGVRGVDFLFPISNHALARRESLDTDQLSRFLRSAFEAWTEAPQASFSVRLFRALILNALGFSHNYFASGATRLGDVVVVETDGAICLDTDFSQIDRFGMGEEYRAGLHLLEDDFSFDQVEQALAARIEEKNLDELPDACQQCQMRSVCRAAHPASRYDDRDGSFDHHSVYCEALYDLCEDIVDYLVEHGYEEHFVDPDLRRAYVA